MAGAATVERLAADLALALTGCSFNCALRLRRSRQSRPDRRDPARARRSSGGAQTWRRPPAARGPSGAATCGLPRPLRARLIRIRTSVGRPTVRQRTSRRGLLDARCDRPCAGRLGLRTSADSTSPQSSIRTTARQRRLERGRSPPGPAVAGPQRAGREQGAKPLRRERAVVARIVRDARSEAEAARRRSRALSSTRRSSGATRRRRLTRERAWSPQTRIWPTRASGATPSRAGAQATTAVAVANNPAARSQYRRATDRGSGAHRGRAESLRAVSSKPPGRGTPTACYSEPFGNIPGNRGHGRARQPTASRSV